VIPVHLDRRERQHAEVPGQRQAAGVPLPEQVKKALPLADLERLLHPAIAFSGRGRPIRLAETGHDSVVSLHQPDRTGTAAGLIGDR
jgi:hypothetical protein